MQRQKLPLELFILLALDKEDWDQFSVLLTCEFRSRPPGYFPRRSFFAHPRRTSYNN